MPITTTIIYTTSDGAKFDTEGQAREHEVGLLIQQFADDNNIADGAWTRAQVVAALKANRQQLRRILTDAVI